jgi:hypothetical protein
MLVLTSIIKYNYLGILVLDSYYKVITPIYNIILKKIKN